MIDNVSCHSQLERAFSEPEFSDNITLRLGLDSPIFNLIKDVWSTAKATVKRKLAKKWMKSWKDDVQGISVREYRLRHLEAASEIGMQEISTKMCVNFVPKFFSVKDGELFLRYALIN